MSDIGVVLGYVIKAKRNERKLTQEKVAELVNIEPNTYQQIEYGRDLPRYKLLFKICEVLEIRPDAVILPMWEDWSKDPNRLRGDE